MRKRIRLSWIIWAAILSVSGLMVAASLGAPILFPPHILMAFAMALDSYIGGDQLAAIMRTRKMPAGKKYHRNRRKLITIVIATFALTVQAFISQSLAAINDIVLDLPAMALFGIFLSSVAMLACGEKIKTAYEGNNTE